MGRLLLSILAFPAELIEDFLMALAQFHAQEDDLQRRRLAATNRTVLDAADLITRNKLQSDIIEHLVTEKATSG